MEQRDLVKDQIEQLGKVLGQIIAGFLGYKSSGRIDQGVEVTNRQLKSELSIDIDELVATSQNELKKYMVERKMATRHVESLGEYLREIGECRMSSNKNLAKTYLSKSLELLDMEDEISQTISFERQHLKSRIEDMLQQCEEIH